MEVAECSIRQACERDVPDHIIDRIRRNDPERRTLFIVNRPYAKCIWLDNHLLQHGDVIVAFDGKLVTSPLQLISGDKSHNALIVRNGQEHEITVPTFPIADFEVSCIVEFCGASFTKPYHRPHQFRDTLPSQIYVNAFHIPSAAFHFGLHKSSFITEVNSVPVNNLDDFVREIGKIEDRAYFTLKQDTGNDSVRVVTMRTEFHYVSLNMQILLDENQRTNSLVSYSSVSEGRHGKSELEGSRMSQGPDPSFKRTACSRRLKLSNSCKGAAKVAAHPLTRGFQT